LQALRWQAGYVVTSRHKTFLARGKLLDGGVVNMMGQHGEIARGHWARKINAAKVKEDVYEELLANRLMAKCPPYTKKRYRDYVRDVILQSYRQADKYDLQGLGRLDFYSLYEGSRRWASGSLSSQTGVVLAPFLNPDYIRAVYSYKGKDKESEIFPWHIISNNSPEWANVPFSEELVKEKICESEKESVEHNSTQWRRPAGGKTYDLLAYWKAVGFPIIREALTRGGFWTEIFDVDIVSKKWQEAPDQVAILHLLSEMIDG
jgi:hypothetical protein